MSIRCITRDALRKVVAAVCRFGHETRHESVTNTPCMEGPRVLGSRRLYWKASMCPSLSPNASRCVRTTPTGMRSSRG